MKQGRHRNLEMVKRGKDIDIGIRFESKLVKRIRKRKEEKKSRKRNRRSK